MRRRVILANNLFVPERLLSEEDLSDWWYEWTEKILEERKDEYGELVLDKRNRPILDPIEVFKKIVTFRRLSTRGTVYLAFPRGNIPKVRALLRKVGKAEDLRPKPPLGFKLRLLKSVKKDKRWKKGQRRCVNEYCRKRYGIVKGDPGSGKTVIGAGIICKLGMKTLILTKRRDGNKHWIKQLRKLTNLSELELRTHQELIGTYTTKQRKVYPITVATVQSFNSKKGVEDLARFQNSFGFLLGDEVHELITHKYRRVPLSFNTRAIAGLTATDERDDRLHYFEYDIFGPVVTQNAGKETEPAVTFIETGTKAPMWIYSKPFNIGWKWNMCMSAIEKSTTRYDIIMKWLRKDLAAKHRIACISPQRRSIVQELARRLRQDGYQVAYVDGDVKNRQKIYDDFNAGKYDILCAGKVLNALVDIQSLDCIHLVSPLKKHAGTKQIYGRAREENAIIRDYVDEGGQLSGAYKSRLKMCEGYGWKIKYVKDDMIERDAEPMGGWVPRGKQPRATKAASSNVEPMGNWTARGKKGNAKSSQARSKLRKKRTR